MIWPEDSWPVTQETSISRIDLESRDKVCNVVIDFNTWFDVLLTRVSSWSKLIRIIAYVLKFLVTRLNFLIPKCEPKENMS